MPVDAKLVDKAVGILTAKYTRDSPVEDLVERLVGFAPFDGMDDEVVEAVAEAARERLPPGRARAAAGKPRGGAPGRPAPARAPEPRRVPDGVVPAAPFRFVELPDQVVTATNTPGLSRPLADGFCAEIAVEWAAETPLLIGETNPETGVVEPLRLGPGGPFVIPGATLRGMIRAAVEIVAHGRLGAANLHHRYGLRDFEHPAYADRSPVSRVDQVKAGWLEWRSGADGTRAWTIAPCDWAHVLIEEVLASGHGRWPTDKREEWIGLDLTKKYEAVGIRRDRSFDFSRTFGFSRMPDDNGRRMVTPGQGMRGTLVFSNKLPGKGGKKKFEYVFFAPTGAPVPVRPEIVATFERLYSKPSKNKPQPDGSWKLLRPVLEAGGRIPVFFVGDLDGQDDRFVFGLTRLFKVPHERSVGSVLFGTQGQHEPKVMCDGEGRVVGYSPDLVEALFGHVVERDELGLASGVRVSPDAAGRKGRVAFSFAMPVPGPAPRLSDPIATVMMAPRASFAPFYLRSAAEKDYSADSPPKLAGRKRYLPRHARGRMAAALDGIRSMGQRQLDAIRSGPGGRDAKDEVQTRLRFLLPAERGGELRFRSRIRLHNVTAAELGAVLFALTHGGDPDKPCRHMVGRARPFGAGQLRVVTARLSVEPNAGKSPLVRPPAADEVADADGLRGFCPPPVPDGEPGADASHRPFLTAFVEAMRAALDQPAFPDVPAVREFLGAAVPAERDRLDYLPLPDFNEVRKAVKPKKPSRDGAPPPPPHRFPQDADGRLLAAPAVRPKLPA